MTAAEFRRIALSFPEAEERSHIAHPDFRVRSKIFATLGYPDKGCGMLRLPPEEQRVYLQQYPAVFSLGPGAWGKQGATMVQLKEASASVIRQAMKAAWIARAPKALVERTSARS